MWETDIAVSWYGLAFVAFIFFGIPPTMTLCIGVVAGAMTKGSSTIRGLATGFVFGIIGTGAGWLALWISYLVNQGSNNSSLFVLFVMPQLLAGICFAALTAGWVWWRKIPAKMTI